VKLSRQFVWRICFCTRLTVASVQLERTQKVQNFLLRRRNNSGPRVDPWGTPDDVGSFFTPKTIRGCQLLSTVMSLSLVFELMKFVLSTARLFQPLRRRFSLLGSHFSRTVGSDLIITQPCSCHNLCSSRSTHSTRTISLFCIFPAVFQLRTSVEFQSAA
jgi:hypothetical protein